MFVKRSALPSINKSLILSYYEIPKAQIVGVIWTIIILVYEYKIEMIKKSSESNKSTLSVTFTQTCYSFTHVTS